MPQEGGRGAEEVGQRLSDYQRLVRRRAAQTSREIKAEQDVKLKLVSRTGIYTSTGRAGAEGCKERKAFYARGVGSY